MKSVAVIGSFDGVHKGHQYLITQARDLALKCGLLLSVITFEPLPSIYLNKTNFFLSSIEERILLLRRNGVPKIDVIDFESVITKSAEEFINLLVEDYEVAKIVVGENFAFGRDRSCTVKDLLDITYKKGVDACVIPLKQSVEGPISSSYIRSLIQSGELIEAANLLGHPYLIYGRVVSGKGRGKTLGFETANLKVSPQKLLPPEGVYAAWVLYKGKLFKGALNIGNSPTFEGDSIIPEIHLLDFKDNLKGEFLEVYPTAFIRKEKKFKDSHELAIAIKSDVEKIRDELSFYTASDYVVKYVSKIV